MSAPQTELYTAPQIGVLVGTRHSGRLSGTHTRLARPHLAPQGDQPDSYETFDIETGAEPGGQISKADMMVVVVRKETQHRPN